jgi:hypothetical protein
LPAVDADGSVGKRLVMKGVEAALVVVVTPSGDRLVSNGERLCDLGQ